MRVILVPLNGEAQDRTALAAAYQVARPFRAHVTGLFIRPDPVDTVGVVQGIPPEMVERVTRAVTATWNERAGPALLARAGQREADLLVMGGYGRSRVHERIFGGVTQHVLDHHDIAVLIAH